MFIFQKVKIYQNKYLYIHTLHMYIHTDIQNYRNIKMNFLLAKSIIFHNAAVYCLCKQKKELKATLAINIVKQGIQYLRFLVLVLSTFGIGIGIGIESIPGLVNGIDPIVNWY